MFIRHAAKVVGRGKAVAMLVNEVAHHGKERLAIAGIRIGEQEVKHAQHERALVIDERLIGARRLGGVEPVTENDWTNVDQLAFARTI